MGMKLEKTFLKVDVLALTYRVDTETAARIAGIAASHEEYDRDLESPVAEVAIAPATAVAEIQFLREGTPRSVHGRRRRRHEEGRRCRLAHERDVPRCCRIAYRSGSASSRNAGSRTATGSRTRSGATPLRTVYWGIDEDEILLDQTDVGRQNVIALLGAYYAPGSSFRRKLVQSLWRGWDPSDP